MCVGGGGGGGGGGRVRNHLFAIYAFTLLHFAFTDITREQRKQQVGRSRENIQGCRIWQGQGTGLPAAVVQWPPLAI